MKMMMRIQKFRNRTLKGSKFFWNFGKIKKMKEKCMKFILNDQCVDQKWWSKISKIGGLLKFSWIIFACGWFLLSPTKSGGSLATMSWLFWQSMPVKWHSERATETLCREITRIPISIILKVFTTSRIWALARVKTGIRKILVYFLSILWRNLNPLRALLPATISRPNLNMQILWWTQITTPNILSRVTSMDPSSRQRISLSTMQNNRVRCLQCIGAETIMNEMVSKLWGTGEYSAMQSASFPRIFKLWDS